MIDDGTTRIGVESTVLDLSDPTAKPMILRPGAVTKEQLETVLGSEVEIDKHLVSEGERPKAPGMKYKHYAPDTKGCDGSVRGLVSSTRLGQAAAIASRCLGRPINL